MELLLLLYILVGIFCLSNKLLLLYRTEPETGNGYNGGLFGEISSENECSVLQQPDNGLVYQHPDSHDAYSPR